MQSSVKLYDWQAFQHIAPYLNIGELIKTATLSKQYNYTLKNYLKKHVLPKQSLQGNQNQLNAMKKIFHRQIKICKIHNNNQQSSFVPNLIMKDIQAGNNHALIQTIQGRKLLVQLSQLTKQNFEIKTFVQLDKKYNTKFVNLIGDYLYVALDNKLLKFLVKQEPTEILNQENQLQLQAQIIFVKQSQTHLFLITQNTFHENKIFAVHLKQFKITEVLYQQTDNQTKHIDIDNLSVAANTAYYLDKCKVYELDVENTKQPKIMKSLKDKQISRIINGAKHFFAIQKSRKLTQEWDTKDLVEWATKEGYEDYIKIFKAQKVTGKTLLNMDKKYMEDVLGIVTVKVQQRLMVQLQEFNVDNEQNSLVYGWGRNDKSQLGLNPSNPVSNPHKVTLPQGFKLLKCFNNITLIHNKKTGQISMNSAFQGKLVWQPVFEKIHNIWSITASKDCFIVLCPVQKDYIPQQLSEVPVHHKKQKLRTAKNIIDKIEWDEKIDKKDFRVGYLDKFTGILEISFEQFLKSKEIKEYRIEYFKRNGEVVWSKKDRIDIL